METTQVVLALQLLFRTYHSQDATLDAMNAIAKFVDKLKRHDFQTILDCYVDAMNQVYHKAQSTAGDVEVNYLVRFLKARKNHTGRRRPAAADAVRKAGMEVGERLTQGW